jgi:hypothetical protein
MPSRRRFNAALPAVLVPSGSPAGCTSSAGEQNCASAVRQTWRSGPSQGLRCAALGPDPVIRFGRGPTLPRCNPPFTPWFLRRNEIWLTLDAATPGDTAP